ncbi:MAG: GspE/PulE family protein [bacterium]|nr:GspE/PulE family protein [bacterium]
MTDSTNNEQTFLDEQQLSAPNNDLVSFNYEEIPITDIVNSIILDGIKRKASDIHFDPYEKGLKIRMRIDGSLMDYSHVPLYIQKNMITRIKIIAGMNITESRVPQDGAIKNKLENVTVDLRVSSLPTNLGEKIVIRILDYSMSSAGIEELDFNKENYNKVLKMISVPNGIILVTGATGTGKSTTVYSILQRLNTEDRNIITVEDPIEMNIEGVNQVQVISEIGLTFANVLRSILRQDPDIIMIGEIRDDETARIAVRASITGHLVLSTIHTNNSLNTIERLTDMSVERYLLGAALTGIISQKLARRLCKHCRTSRQTTDYEKKVFKDALNIEVNEIYEPKGCEHCHQGYAGRIAIHEVLLINQAIRDAIVSNASKPELRKLVYKSGTITMLQDGLSKVVTGETTFEEILKLIDLEDDLGTDTNLGLQETIKDSLTNNKARDYEVLDL